jgi:hypothetical protein
MKWIKKLQKFYFLSTEFNPLNAELNPICHLLALLGTHHILHISRVKVKRQDLSWQVQDGAADKLTIPNFDLFYWNVEGSKNDSHSDPPFSTIQHYVETT